MISTLSLLSGNMVWISSGSGWAIFFNQVFDYTVLMTDEDEESPGEQITLGVMMILAGLFMTRADSYNLAIFGGDTGISIVTVGWIGFALGLFMAGRGLQRKMGGGTEE